MSALVICGDARALPLPDESVDLVVTSPPYFALRAYQDGGEVYDGQIGSEPTPADYIATLVECTREWVRVLKPSGSLFVNLGDSYYSGKGAPGKTTVDAKSEARTVRRQGGNPLDGPSFGVGRKSLVGLPWRYALACIDQLGLILRAEVIWSKPNGLPESVVDRVRRSHEQWFHLVKQPRYYSAVDEIREAYLHPNHARPNACQTGRDKIGQNLGATSILRNGYDGPPNPLGKLPGSVWEIPSEPLKVPAERDVEHFAAFPTEWPKRLVAGWSPPGICVECGEGRRPVADRTKVGGWTRGTEATRRRAGSSTGGGGQKVGARVHDHISVAITGYACACPEPTGPTRPAVVLDPFGGTGTTALVASALGRIGLTIDRSADYCRLATWRTSDPAQRAKVLGVAKPPVQVEGQLSLIDGLENNEGEVA